MLLRELAVEVERDNVVEGRDVKIVGEEEVLVLDEGDEERILEVESE